MGLDIGDDVFVSFISNGQEANVYRELLIASASLQELDSAPKSITIPDELMENAGIMPDSAPASINGKEGAERYSSSQKQAWQPASQ